MIRFKNVTKRYPGMVRSAVDGLSLEVNQGETCVFVGPSGCGKTTTLKMVNRIFEPTSGEILVNGENILSQDQDTLRQGIGYVIQKTGLFPHYTVFENVATVPRLLGWDHQRINSRVHELLRLVGLDPDENAHKYPRELSGGQSQRVGVARALAADPPVMLMDEPFGAVDPITRTQLQNEFLTLQQKVRKTICFVTHDIDEAIKMGNRIAIMNNGRLVQYDTPEKLLLAPADDFVAEFIGSDRSLKVLSLLPVPKVLKRQFRVVKETAELETVRASFDATERNRLVIEDENSNVVGYVTRGDAGKASSARGWNRFIKPFPTTLPPEATLRDALAVMLQHDVGAIPVMEHTRKFLGMVYLDDIRSYVGEAYQESEPEPAGEGAPS
ncbi:MAG: ATP-binding cassette domain-containing protein [Spirochaetaceae bacterium]|nr:MAG: ATP-binding cassette domain-containing protein [Spirochaetaceae bacterium]